MEHWGNDDYQSKIKETQNVEEPAALLFEHCESHRKSFTCTTQCSHFIITAVRRSTKPSQFGLSWSLLQMYICVLWQVEGS
jgi:hypothetical protein